MALDLLVSESNLEKDIVTQCCECRKFKTNKREYKLYDSKEVRLI